MKIFHHGLYWTVNRRILIRVYLQRNSRNFLASWGTVCFSIRPLLHGVWQSAVYTNTARPPQWRYLFKANLATDRITNPENTRLVRPVRSTVITRTRTRLDRLYQNKYAQSYILRLPIPLAPPTVYSRGDVFSTSSSLTSANDVSVCLLFPPTQTQNALFSAFPFKNCPHLHGAEAHLRSW